METEQFYGYSSLILNNNKKKLRLDSRAFFNIRHELHKSFLKRLKMPILARIDNLVSFISQNIFSYMLK